MKSKFLALPLMLLREALSAPRLERRPEPSVEMDDPKNVIAFHEQGSSSGPLLPVYHFNALATSRLIPEGGTLLDLGSGSGQYLAYLSQRRPDMRIIGLDLSAEMVRRGRIMLDEMDLSSRIELRLGDMTCFRTFVRERLDGVSSVFALHHLPSVGALDGCLAEIAWARSEFGCAIWLFDHARPRHPCTPEIFPEIFTPDAPEIFRADSKNSLIASWSFSELSEHLNGSDLMVSHACARFMPLYQAHWMESNYGRLRCHSRWVNSSLSPKADSEFNNLKKIFPDVLLD